MAKVKAKIKYTNRIEVAEDVKEFGIDYFLTGNLTSWSMPDEEIEGAFEGGDVNAFTNMLPAI